MPPTTGTIWYNTCAECLGRVRSLLIDILNPEVIIMGSIFGRAKSLLDARMMQVIEREAYIVSAHARSTKLSPPDQVKISAIWPR